MEEQNLYQNVKKKICKMIFEDIYQDGDHIPPERKLSEELGVSRVTIRKALKLLEEEHIIERIQGSGTRVALEYGARTGNMDIITLVAPAQNAFFSRFIDAFQTTAEQYNSLVLYKQKQSKNSLEKCLFQIYEKDLRNVVLWLDDMELSQESLRKLRGLGMNIVLFDTAVKTPYADSVCLDNCDAIKRLCQKLILQDCRAIGYIGWDEERVHSVRIRESAFQKYVPEGKIYRIPWKYRNCLRALPAGIVRECFSQVQNCEGILYGDGELGMYFEGKWEEQALPHKAMMVDNLPGADLLNVQTLEQDFQKMSEKIFDCLKRQNQEGSAWSAGLYRVKGQLD